MECRIGGGGLLLKYFTALGQLLPLDRSSPSRRGGFLFWNSPCLLRIFSGTHETFVLGRSSNSRSTPRFCNGQSARNLRQRSSRARCGSCMGRHAARFYHAAVLPHAL